MASSRLSESSARRRPRAAASTPHWPPATEWPPAEMIVQHRPALLRATSSDMRLCQFRHILRQHLFWKCLIRPPIPWRHETIT
ncbi:hypothetical protein VTO73DRAFT_5865 [Trametes versicolor]